MASEHTRIRSLHSRRSLSAFLWTKLRAPPIDRPEVSTGDHADPPSYNSTLFYINFVRFQVALRPAKRPTA